MMYVSPVIALLLLCLSLNLGLQCRNASIDLGTGCNDTNATSVNFESPSPDNDKYDFVVNRLLDDITIDEKTAKSFLQPSPEWEYDNLLEALRTEVRGVDEKHRRLKRSRRPPPEPRVPETWHVPGIKEKTPYLEGRTFKSLQQLSSKYDYFKYKKWPEIKRSGNRGTGGWFLPKPGRWHANLEKSYVETPEGATWENVYAVHKDHFDEGVSFEYACLIYSWYYCNRRGRFWTSNSVQHNMCPQPCLSNPCNFRDHASRCQQTGPYQNPDYSCSCELGWQWNNRRKRCDDRNVCNTNHNRCNSAHTRNCIEGIGMDHRCECLDGFVGEFCSDERNPCVEDGGHDACQPRGRCVPSMRSHIYSCDCDDGWSDEPETGGPQYPDCRHKDDPCGRVACMNGGACEHSQNGEHVYCVCNDAYVGDRCQYRRPYLGPWESWGPCSVTCGAQGIRKRRRHCEDPAGLTDYDCSGKNFREEEEVCQPAVCKYSGRWTSWGETTPCTVICGHGYRTRSRHCRYCKDPECVEETQLEAEHGSPCDGIAQEKSPCNTQPCPAEELAVKYFKETRHFFGDKNGEVSAKAPLTFFTEFRGKYFGDRDTLITDYEDIDADECARRCLEGYGDYDGVNPICKSFNWENYPMSVLIAQTAMIIPGVDPSQFKALGSGGNPRKCWLHRENKDTHPANPEWNHWPSRIYFQRKEKEEEEEENLSKIVAPGPSGRGPSLTAFRVLVAAMSLLTSALF
ncbi:uncharacterized protein LOC144860870 [Branchiostoma floridae x Branchiostoma japonicum]